MLRSKPQYLDRLDLLQYLDRLDFPHGYKQKQLEDTTNETTSQHHQPIRQTTTKRRTITYILAKEVLTWKPKRFAKTIILEPMYNDRPIFFAYVSTGRSG